MSLKVIGTQAHSFRTEKTHGPDVRLIQTVCPDDFTLCRAQGFFVIGHVHAQNVCRAEKSVSVLLEAEN